MMKKSALIRANIDTLSEISQLRQQIKDLQNALRPFANFAANAQWEKTVWDDDFNTPILQTTGSLTHAINRADFAQARTTFFDTLKDNS